MSPAQDTFPFGKHKGRFYGEVPADYLRWALGAMPDLYPPTKDRIKSELARRGLSLQEELPATPSGPRRSRRQPTPQTPSEHAIHCHRCGLTPGGRPMIHLECLDDDDPPPF